MLSNVLLHMVAYIIEDQMLMCCDEAVVFYWNSLIAGHEQIIVPSTGGSLALQHLIKELSKVSCGTIIKHREWSGDVFLKLNTSSGHEVNDLDLS